MITLMELREKWEARRTEAKRCGYLAAVDAVCSDVLTDLIDLAQTSDSTTLNLTEAAATTGFHPGSIARMIKTGKAKNYGTSSRPRVRPSELPRKARCVSDASGDARPSLVSSVSDDALALDAVASRMGRSTGMRG
ncbi:MAG: hypothetical protein JWL61_5453 [Gemmatimonadetes bacterium]|nr:hypothetical protein [Gemmatimonadota bacterium]